MTEKPFQRPAPIACEVAVRRLWDHIDGRLPALARDEVEAHLDTCILCGSSFAFARAMKETLGELGAAETPTQVEGDGRNALSARIQDGLRRAHRAP